SQLVLFIFTTSSPPAIYSPSLHDALPISADIQITDHKGAPSMPWGSGSSGSADPTNSTPGNNARRKPLKACSRCKRVSSSPAPRSEEHTSELQSRIDIVCRLLLEK